MEGVCGVSRSIQPLPPISSDQTVKWMVVVMVVEVVMVMMMLMAVVVMLMEVMEVVMVLNCDGGGDADDGDSEGD